MKSGNKAGNRYATSKRRSRNNWKPYVDMPLLRPAQEEMFAVAVQTGKQAASRLATASTLTAVELRKLQAQVQVGQAARIDLWGPNIRLALQQAQRWNKGFVDVNDLEIYAAHGLWRATDTFDPEKGYRFSTYAMVWIKSYLQRGRLSELLIQMPEDVWLEVLAVQKFQTDFLHESHEAPSVDEIAMGVGASVERVIELLQLSHDLIYYDQTVGEEGEQTMIGLLADETYAGLEAVDNKVDVLALLGRLDESERRVVVNRIGGEGPESTRRAVATAEGVTESAVRTLEKSALSRLRAARSEEEGR